MLHPLEYACPLVGCQAGKQFAGLTNNPIALQVHRSCCECQASCLQRLRLGQAEVKITIKLHKEC